MKTNNTTKGFTLIELLVVIAIIAILAVVVVLTLNPAQLLAQSRDSNRVSDMATLKSAIALYQADQSTTTLGTAGQVQEAYSVTVATGTLDTTTTGWYGYRSGDIPGAVVTSSVRAVDGSGWLPIQFSSISSGAPFGSLPVDPLGTAINTACAHWTGGSGNMPCLYTFLSSATGTYKLAIGMESSKYGFNGSGDVVTNDGGNSTSSYEAGSAPSL